MKGLKDIFASIYELAIAFYGDNLGSYLYGLCDGGDGGLYAQIGLSMFGITSISCMLFYFVFTNSKWYKFGHWFFFLIIGALLTGIVAFLLPYLDFSQGLICPQFIFKIEDIIFFGIINVLLSAFLFFILSLVLKYVGKPQARYTPF